MGTSLEGLQICRAAANILKKQLQTADREWLSSNAVGLDRQVYTLKNTTGYDVLHKDSDLDGFGIIKESGSRA